MYKEPTVLITVTLGLCYVLPSFSSKSTHHLLQEEPSPPRAAPAESGRLWTTPSLPSVSIFTSAPNAPCCDILHVYRFPPSLPQSVVRGWSHAFIHPSSLTEHGVWANEWVSSLFGIQLWEKLEKNLKRLTSRLKVYLGLGLISRPSPLGILPG